MTNQQIAAARFTAFSKEMTDFIFGEWATMRDVAARDAREAEIEARHGVRHGWMIVNGEGFNTERAFPDQKFPRFPADHGLSD